MIKPEEVKTADDIPPQRVFHMICPQGTQSFCAYRMVRAQELMAGYDIRYCFVQRKEQHCMGRKKGSKVFRCTWCKNTMVAMKKPKKCNNPACEKPFV